MHNTTIFFISETAPVNTHASSVIFYRHFKMLESEGYKIIWVTDQNSYNRSKDIVPKGWGVALLPNRRWHLPPYKAKGISQAYRFYYYYHHHLKKIVTVNPSAVIVTYINGQFLTPFAAYVSIKSKLPLLSFFHDDILELNFYKNKRSLIKNTNKVLGASNKILAVSEQFKNNWKKYSDKFLLLYPIPEKYEGTLKPKSLKDNVLTFGYSGAMYDEIVPCLMILAQTFKLLNHKLIIIGDKTKTVSIQKQFTETVTCLDLFDTPNEASTFMVENCDAAIIPYPDNLTKMPWIATCYPSKFLQYCQLNLPTLIIAPTNSSIGKWCLDHNWPLYSPNYNATSITKLIKTINDEPAITLMQSLKHNDFNPDKIHNQLKEIIKDLIAHTN